jgi:glycosyltransferase involved in cell wall biosynthesis
LKALIPLISLNTIQRKYHLEFNNTEGYFTSRWNKKFHSKHLIECEKFKAISTGIDLRVFPYYEKHINPSSISLLFVGRISEEKGFLLLLNQMDHLRLNSKKKILLTVIGNFKNNDEKNIIQETITKLGLDNKVIFLGKIERNKLFEYYHQASFTVFPSLCNEAFSRVPLESMACGTPCISTDNPGSKELFDLNAPLVFLDRSKDGLAKGIESIFSIDGEYEKVSINGKKFIEERFTFNHFMENVQRHFLIAKMDK